MQPGEPIFLTQTLLMGGLWATRVGPVGNNNYYYQTALPAFILPAAVIFEWHVLYDLGAKWAEYNVLGTIVFILARRPE